MKKWLVNNFKKIIGTVPITISMCILIWSDMENDRLVLLLAASILFLVAINFSEITRLRIGKDGIDFEKEKLKELNREAQVTIDKLNSTIEPLLKFNLSLLHKDGSFDNVTDFDAIVNFLISSSELLDDMPLTIQNELIPYLDEGVDNALHSFMYKAENIIGKGGEKVRNFVNYSNKYTNLDKTRPDYQMVNIEGLRNLNNNEDYLDLVTRLEKFLEKFKPELLNNRKISEGNKS